MFKIISNIFAKILNYNSNRILVDCIRLMRQNMYFIDLKNLQ